MKKWIVFFSQTGSEINNISKITGVLPDLIITNKQDLSNVNSELLSQINKFYILPKKPQIEDYLNLIQNNQEIFKDCVITLHGYLRIIPDFMCDMFEIYNLHPGLITKYPQLKGFNPQEKAYNMNLPTSGAVIHKVTSDLDGGKILSSIEIPIKNKSLEQVYSDLHKCSTDLWIKFFKENILNLSWDQEKN